MQVGQSQILVLVSSIVRFHLKDFQHDGHDREPALMETMQVEMTIAEAELTSTIVLFLFVGGTILYFHVEVR